MAKETSPEVSTLAGQILAKARDPKYVPGQDVEFLWDAAKSLAGSAMSQDMTPGREPPNFVDRLKLERSQLASRTGRLKAFIYKGAPRVDDYQRQLLGVQLDTMQSYLRILDIRISKLDPVLSEKPLPVASAEPGEPVEVGGHDEDKDGPVPFSA